MAPLRFKLDAINKSVRPTWEAVKAPGPRAILASRLSAWGFLVCRGCLWYCEDTWSLMNLGKRRGHLGRSFPPPCQSLDRFRFSYDESSIVKIPQSLLPSRGKGRRITSPCLSSRLAAAGRLLDQAVLNKSRCFASSLRPPGSIMFCPFTVSITFSFIAIHLQQQTAKGSTEEPQT